MRNGNFLFLAGILGAFFSLPISAQVSTTNNSIIALPENSSVQEETASKELSDYLHRITGKEFHVVKETQIPQTSGMKIFVGTTDFAAKHGISSKSMGAEEWIVRAADPKNLIIAGGVPRGALYGTYHFLEDVIGVHWWNPVEEYVPVIKELDISGVNLHGKPSFNHRGMGNVFSQDKGLFSARNRLNFQLGEPISMVYGGGLEYGPPSFIHTFYKYFAPKFSSGNQSPINETFNTHPEYFSLINGKRTKDRGQLCLTNKELQNIFVEKLREFIKQGEENAKNKNLSTPSIYDISIMDWRGACECEKCQLISKAENSEAGPLLDFLNPIADIVKKEYPYVQISTAAYLHTAQLPQNIRPRDNISILLCNTDVNRVKDISSPDNASFQKLVKDWTGASKNVRIYEYVISFSPIPELPTPSLRQYAANFRFYRENGVDGMFLENGKPIIMDMQDLKIWVMIKLMENPYADYDKLVATFTDGYYGDAGKYIREYLSELEKAAEKNPVSIGLRPSLSHYKFLTLEFLINAHKLFDKALQTVKDDNEKSKRVRHARMSLDRATAFLYPRLTKEWTLKGNNLKNFPFSRQEILDRYLLSFNEQVKLRNLKPRWIANNAEKEIEKIKAMPEYIDPPAKFKEYESWRIFDYPAYTSSGFRRLASVVEDKETESGKTVRIEWPLPQNQYTHSFPIEKYKQGIPWGIWRSGDGKYVAQKTIALYDIPGPGYHWYSLGRCTLKPEDCVIFCDGLHGFDIGDAPTHEQREQVFEVWARVKFEGPVFPYGKAEDKNAVCVERVVALDVTNLKTAGNKTVNP